MRRSRKRSAQHVGAAVLVTFLLGLVSAPVRSCVSHPEHAHPGAAAPGAAHGTSHAAHGGHGALHATPSDDAPADGAEHVGCECLGLCQLESSPPLPLTGVMAAVAEPGPRGVPEPEVFLAPAAASPFATSLARAPPALV